MSALRSVLVATFLILIAGLAPAGVSRSDEWTLDVRLPWLVDVAVLHADDPRSIAERAKAPDAAEGLWEGTLVATGATIRLVETDTETVGLVLHLGVPHWVRVEGGAIVSAASSEVVVPSHEHEEPFAPSEPEAPLAEGVAADNDNVLRLRIVADSTLYKLVGNTWYSHALDMVYLTEWIYWAHFGITFDAEYWYFSTTDPYGAPLNMCGGTGTYIRNFRDHEETQVPVATSPHDISHMLTGRDFPDAVGCAYVGAVDTTWAYSITHLNAANAVELKRNTLIMAHEIGHNFAGTHDRAAPMPGGAFQPGACYAIPVTILWPGCQTLEPPIFSDGKGASPSLLASANVMRDGGNMPWMRSYADPRV